MTTTEAVEEPLGRSPGTECRLERDCRPDGSNLACASCSAPPSHGPFHPCGTCGGTLEVSYDAGRIRDRAAWLRGRPHTIWGYSELLPEVSDVITIGEGDTPLVASRKLHRAFTRNIFWKNEGANPTLSHKDRFQSVAASVARALGDTGIVGTSTGITGSQARRTPQSRAEVADVLPAGDVHGIPALDVAVRRTRGCQRMGTTAAALACVRERPGWCPVDGSNPFGMEGYKTIAYEIVRDLGHAPAMVLIPVGSGKLFTGMARGFRDLVALGLIEQLPRLIACQAAGVDVLTEPFEKGETTIPRRDDISTIALSTKEPTADARVLTALRDSGGAIVNVEEGAIVNALRALGRDGLAVEPASALTAAAVRDASGPRPD